MCYLFRPRDAAQRTSSRGTQKRILSALFGKRARDIVHCDCTVAITLGQKQLSELSSTNSHRFLQHGSEHWLKLARRTADHLQHISGGSLLLEGFTQFVEEARIVDGDDGLRSKILYQLDLLVGERPHLPAINCDNADCLVLLEQRHSE